MKKSRIYNLAMGALLERLFAEQDRRTESIANGQPHRIADARIARMNQEYEELQQMILDAEANDE